MELRLPKHYICTVRSHEQTDIELKLGTLDDRHKFGIKALLDSSLSEMELKPATLREYLYLTLQIALCLAPELQLGGRHTACYHL